MRTDEAPILERRIDRRSERARPALSRRSRPSARRRFGVAAVVFAAILATTGVAAQTVAEIRGSVTDSSGAPLAGALVSATNDETGIVHQNETGVEGLFALRALAPGHYSVEIEHPTMQSFRGKGIELLVGQSLPFDVVLQIPTIEEAVVVTTERSTLESGRSSAATYVTSDEIEQLPTPGRDFKQFAFLAPTAQEDTVQGFITLSGQRGVNTGFNLDGSSNKSAFYGYGFAGEATQSSGTIVAQDSVREFQVITAGFKPEYGASAGGYVNVVTRSGTNDLKASVFFYHREDDLVDDQPSSPLDDSRGIDGSRPSREFEHQNWGVSVGGPIRRDKTHYFATYDQIERSTPFTEQLRTRGAYDAILRRAAEDPDFLSLIDGFVPNDDGTTDGDPDTGRTATGVFTRSTDNLILFGRVDHRFNDRHSGAFRVNFTDYSFASTFKDEESDKAEDTLSVLASLYSVFGNRHLNEARVQFSVDDLDRNSQRVGEPIEAEIRFVGNAFSDVDSVGKASQLPLRTREKNLHIQDGYSYLFGEHDLKFGAEYRDDAMRLLFAGRADGLYDFESFEAFLSNEASRASIFFGDATFPNYAESQETVAVYMQDSWRASERWSLNYGIRFSATFNPDPFGHLLPEGQSINDDTDNLAPRLGFTYRVDDDSVIRGGAGLFYSQTPALLFALQFLENGLFPNFGITTVRPDENGYVPLGTPIDNANPPPDTTPSPFYVDPSFEDPETLRLNLGYERRFGSRWKGSIDLLWAEGRRLHSNVDVNRTRLGTDPFGRPVYSLQQRPIEGIGEIATRQSIGESRFRAATLSVTRRASDRYQLQAHYTWSRDEDTDSNERNAVRVTVSDIDDPRYDWGLSDRDVEHRLLVSGRVRLPWDLQLSGIAELRSGRPFTAIDAGDNVQRYPDRQGPDARAVFAGRVVGRNTFRDESIRRLDARLLKSFDRAGLVIFADVFNLLGNYSFATRNSQREPFLDDGTPNAEFGIPSQPVSIARQYQLAVRFRFE